jgi:hypothetical protein
VLLARSRSIHIQQKTKSSSAYEGASREAAKECSPRRKAWERSPNEASPEGAKETILFSSAICETLF